MSEAVKTYEGWYAYHDFRKIDWNRWRSPSPEKREEVIRELVDVLREFASVEDSRSGSFGQYAVFGHKADLLFIHFRPTIDELNEVKWRFDKNGLCRCDLRSHLLHFGRQLSAYTVPRGPTPERSRFPGAAAAEHAESEICLLLSHGQAAAPERQLVHAPRWRSGGK